MLDLLRPQLLPPTVQHGEWDLLPGLKDFVHGIEKAVVPPEVQDCPLSVRASNPHQQAEDPLQVRGLEGGDHILVQGLDEDCGVLGQVLHTHVVSEVIQVPGVAGHTVEDEQCFVQAMLGAVPRHSLEEVHEPLLEEAHGPPGLLVEAPEHQQVGLGETLERTWVLQGVHQQGLQLEVVGRVATEQQRQISGGFELRGLLVHHGQACPDG